jgi:hydrogenase nickel incorporation protein HypA/HybF
VHELSIVQGILQAALDEAKRGGGKRIREIHARVRESGHPMEASSLQSLLETLAKGTMAEEAEIKIEVISPTLRCKECDATFLAQGGTLFCPHCQSGRLELLDAEEIDLECDFAE